MATFTKEEKLFVHALVEKELNEIERHEHSFQEILSNSPVLGALRKKLPDVQFLAAQEHYHQFLQGLLKKL